MSAPKPLTKMLDGKPSRLPRPQFVHGNDLELAVRGKPPIVSEFRPEDPANVPHFEQPPIEYPKDHGVTDAPITGRSIPQQARRSEDAMLGYLVPKSKGKTKIIPPVIGQ